jgi:hypothetical protein
VIGFAGGLQAIHYWGGCVLVTMAYLFKEYIIIKNILRKFGLRANSEPRSSALYRSLSLDRHHAFDGHCKLGSRKEPRSNQPDNGDECIGERA